MAPKPETRTVKKILAGLKEVPNSFWFKVHGGPFQLVGISDILGVCRGWFVAIEVKQPGKEPTEIQKLFLAKVKAAGGIVGVAYSLPDALEIIAKIPLDKGK